MEWTFTEMKAQAMAKLMREGRNWQHLVRAQEGELGTRSQWLLKGHIQIQQISHVGCTFWLSDKVRCANVFKCVFQQYLIFLQCNPDVLARDSLSVLPQVSIGDANFEMVALQSARGSGGPGAARAPPTGLWERRDGVME